MLSAAAATIALLLLFGLFAATAAAAAAELLLSFEVLLLCGMRKWCMREGGAPTLSHFYIFMFSSENRHMDRSCDEHRSASAFNREISSELSFTRSGLLCGLRKWCMREGAPTLSHFYIVIFSSENRHMDRSCEEHPRSGLLCGMRKCMREGAPTLSHFNIFIFSSENRHMDRS